MIRFYLSIERHRRYHKINLIGIAQADGLQVICGFNLEGHWQENVAAGVLFEKSVQVNRNAANKFLKLQVEVAGSEVKIAEMIVDVLGKIFAAVENVKSR